MRILIVSDIHGNRAALEAVAAEPHDEVICLGDIVGYGPEPRACVQWVRDNATWIVQGNHDRANGQGVAPRCHPDFAWLAEAVVPLTRAQLSDDDREFLSSLPRWVTRDLDGLRVACFHAKPSDPLYGYMPNDRAAWLWEVENVEADLILVGHTHVPLDLTLDDRRVVNPGSVGQPKHRDARAAYAVLEDGILELKQIEYPVEDTIAALASSRVDPRAVDVLSEMLRTGRAPRTTADGSVVAAN
jgi:putative phosphoesterase